MIDKLQYLGEISHDDMYVDGRFITDSSLPFNKVYYRMINLDNGIHHQWFVSQNEQYLDEGHMFTEQRYSGLLRALDMMIGEWRSEK